MVNRYEYKGYTLFVQYEDHFSYVAICNGYEVCRGTSINITKAKFQTLIDSGLQIKQPRVIGE
ncbi:MULTISPECIES: hypothetical protein [Metabacillus]|uniref:hypothetical protein n=1 Tax=Metabacillus TaxID=2675233 RepID=UPI000C7FD3AB|nr:MULTISPECIES: hypothetical protein [Metabacillus]MCM3443947.1 hypothetical protein [Metabacillus halosaccharovorans]PMC35000.1 hypothetical protein CJ195_21065 [Bacillus sp. UMB0899]